MTKDEFDRNVKQWARDRGIIPGSTVGAQLGKTMEEIGELWQAIDALDGDAILDAFGDIDVTLVITDQLCERRDHEGDVIVPPTFGTLLSHVSFARDALDNYGVLGARNALEGIATDHGIDIAQAREHAWEQIKDRTGQLIDGVFVKDAT